jgi:hypothetical protein
MSLVEATFVAILTAVKSSNKDGNNKSSDSFRAVKLKAKIRVAAAKLKTRMKSISRG